MSAGTPGTPWGLQGACTNTPCPLHPAETASCLQLPPVLPRAARCPRAPGMFRVPLDGAGRAQQHPHSSARPPGAAGAPRATAGPRWHPAARPGGRGSAQLPATPGKAVRDGDGAIPRASGKPRGRGEAESWGFPHGRSLGRSRSLSRRHTVPRDSREPSPERRVEPSAPPWPGPGLLEPGGERGGTGRASGSGTCPIGLRARSWGAVDLTLVAPGCQPLEPSLCRSGKRPWGGWRSRSEQPQPHWSRDQQRGPRTLQPAPAWLQPGAQPQPPGAQQTTRTTRPTGGPSHPDRQPDRPTLQPARRSWFIAV